MVEIPEDKVGVRFTQNYRRRGEETSDSLRARRRFGALLDSLSADRQLIAAVARELGVRANLQHYWAQAIEKFSLDDFLDMPTIVLKMMIDVSRAYAVSNWEAFLNEARRIFAEEQIGYIIDDLGGVHRRVDAEFEVVKDAAVAGLNDPRYAAARAEFEKGLGAIDGGSPDYGAAIRDVFFAVEAVFKTVAPKALRLGKAETNTYLKPVLDRLFHGRTPEQQVAAKLAAQLAEWADAGHFYRHAKGGEEGDPPPEDIAIALIHQGAAHLRWLIDIDQRILASEQVRSGAK